MLNLHTEYPGAAQGAVSGSDNDSKKYLLYIVSRGGKALADDIFSAMRRDMTNASVELIYDRRIGERRSQDGATSDAVAQDRRKSDRRHVDATKEITTRGWARIEVE